MNTEYTAEIKGLKQLREQYNLSQLLAQSYNYNSLLEFSKALNIKYGFLTQAIEEAKILAIFPNIEKSKAAPLSRLRTKQDLIYFANKYNIHKLEVRELYKLVKKYNKKLEKNPRILLTDLQHDLIIGTMFGDGNIRQINQNCSFRVAHSPKQKSFLELKYNILKNFTSKGINISQRFINERLINTFQFSTRIHYVFNYYRKLFYKNRTKTITRKVLDLLNPRSLAIWICDDGSYCKNLRYIILCTNSYSLEEHKIMKKYFEEIWNLSPTIGFRDKKYYYLRFKVEDTKKLISIIKKFIPKGMGYKIGK